ncbi:uncharacterized protein LOC132611550 [Lycium barbarum]|uniref:uncharacterized protein LOC132611550 n=1 Tax=Lycium barbarum TaxID=112863 RepID=UPI00293F2862|nr:uncharacterized protein LOC132611550 [Lycium barbarum]
MAANITHFDSGLAYKTFVLWNPSTRQCLELASCPYLNTYTIPHASGLCYDPTTDDYKVILIYKPFYLIYSLRNFWTKKTTLPMLEQRLSSSLKQVTNNLWSSYICCQGITTEGCVYWSLDPELCPYVRRGSTIIYYDVKLEKLKELQAPIFVGDDNELFLLTTFKGRLCLYGGESTDLRSNETDLDMWIMEEDGWKLLMKLHYVPSTVCEHYFVRHSRLLCCTENGEIIFKGPKNSQISIYYPKKQKIVIKDVISGYNIGYEYGRDEYPTCLDSLHFPKIITHKKKRKIVSV